MAYQEVTKTSYGSRLGNSLKGIVSGLLLFVAATVLLWWNEGNAKKTADAIKGFAKECVDVADVSVLDPALNGKPIHATAVAMTDETLTDPDYGIQVGAIWLKRSTEYYQWVEHQTSETKDKIGGGQETVTTYDYTREWVDHPVNSNAFHDPDYQGVNTIRLEVPDKEIRAGKVSFGAYTLSPSLVNAIPADEPVVLPADLGDNQTSYVSNNVLYYGENPNSPAVGDVRVTFTEGTGGDASILAQVVGDTFEPYTHKNGKTIQALSMGVHSLDSMVESEKAANKTILWLLRILGIILVIAALRMMFSIVVTVLKVLPPLAKVGELGVNLVTGVVGFIWSLLVILVAWVVYRPLVAIPLAVAIAALVFFLIKKSKDAPEPAPAAPVAPEAPKSDAA